MRIVSIATVLVLAVAAVGAAQPPDGERLYNRNCARCHESNLPLLFSSGPIREYPAERVYEALSAGIMAAQATGLTKADKRAVAEYVSGSAAGSLVPPLDQIPEAAYCASGGAVPSDPYAGPSWNGWSPDRSNARFHSAEAAGLTANSVPDLSLRWAFGFPGVTVASFQATIVGGRALVGTSVGVVYALSTRVRPRLRTSSAYGAHYKPPSVTLIARDGTTADADLVSGTDSLDLARELGIRDPQGRRRRGRRRADGSGCRPPSPAHPPPTSWRGVGTAHPGTAATAPPPGRPDTPGGGSRDRTPGWACRR